MKRFIFCSLLFLCPWLAVGIAQVPQPTKKVDPKTQPTKAKTPDTKPKIEPKPKVDPKPPDVPQTPIELPISEEPLPTSTLDLARRLTGNGQADLALEYLEHISRKATPAERADLNLEKANTRLEYAGQENDEVKRDAQIELAKTDFETFLRTSANHPRAAEAKIAIARVMTMQARSQLTRAIRADKEDLEFRIKAEARPIFDEADKKYNEAIAGLESAAKNAAQPKDKQNLTNAWYQALLDQAISQYYYGETYKTLGQEVTPRYNSFKKAQGMFLKLSNLDEKHPTCWIAKAWAADCRIHMSEAPRAEEDFKAIETALRKDPTNRGIAAGYRMSRYFLLIMKANDVVGQKTVKPFQDYRKSADDWLKDYERTKPTAEGYKIRYYKAMMFFKEAELGVIVSKDGKVTIPDSVVSLLRIAERDFRYLVQNKNEYDTRAKKKRLEVIRVLVGKGDKPLDQFTDFDQCHMTMLVNFQNYNEIAEQDVPEEAWIQKLFLSAKKSASARVLALLQKEKELPIPKESARDSQDSALIQLSVLKSSGWTYESAVLAEHIARTSLSPSLVSKAGQTAVVAYMESAELVNVQESALKSIDNNRAMALAMYIDNLDRSDIETDNVRYLLLNLLLRSPEKRYNDAFNVASRISPRSSFYIYSRLSQGGLAYELVRPNSTSSKDLTEQQRDGIRNRAIRDLQAVQEPTKEAETEVYLKIQLQLCQLYLTGSPDLYTNAEKLARATLDKISKSKLEAAKKDLLKLTAETILIDTVYGQAMPRYKNNQFKEALEQFAPMLADIAKSGQAFKDGMDEGLKDTAKNLDATRMNKVIVPALNASIRAGDIKSAEELMNMARTFGGGDIGKSIQVVFSVVTFTKPQIEQLNKDGRVDEAKKLTADVTSLVVKLAKEPNLKPDMLYNLGRSLKDLGDYGEAVKLLAGIPAPADPTWLSVPNGPPQPPAPVEGSAQFAKQKADLDKWNASKEATPLYRGARIEMARCYRIARMIPEADALYADVMKMDGQKKVGWGWQFPDFRTEFFNYSEVKAAAAKAANDPKAQSLWVAAIGNWAGLAGALANAVIGESKKDVVNLFSKSEDTRKVAEANMDARIGKENREMIQQAAKAKADELNAELWGADATKREEAKKKLEAEMEKAFKSDDEKTKFSGAVAQTRGNIRRVEGMYCDAVFETIRCTVETNLNLFADKPPTLEKGMATQAKKIFDIEEKNNPPLPEEVRTKYREMILKHKPLEKAYKDLGGKGFPVQAPPANTNPMPAPGTPMAPMAPMTRIPTPGM